MSIAIPYIIEPGPDDPTELDAFASARRASILEALECEGAVLLRRLGGAGPAAFERAAEHLGAPLMDYQDRAAHRSPIAGRVYTSADYPPKHEIFLHNEATYARRFPRKLFLHCVTPAASGGATPLADAVAVQERLPREIVRAFARRGVSYVRNFGTGAFGPSWQDAFQTEDRDELEDYCRRSGIETEWLGGDRLRTRQTRPALIRHPRSGRSVWFNHAAALHVSTLPGATRRTVLKLFTDADYPCNTYYGDGSPIEPDVLDAIRKAYADETITFEWHEGDLLVLDNLRVAHGRSSFKGPRRVLAVLADPAEWQEMEVPSVDEL
jgi:alpha-ketoglutarate-dependent taurine dioxygenase